MNISMMMRAGLAMMLMSVWPVHAQPGGLASKVGASCSADFDCALGEVCSSAACIVDTEADRDRDGVPDGSVHQPRDNCPDTPNPDQRDTDGDRRGDACDPDIDGDEIPNLEDHCPLLYTRLRSNYDSDGDGIGDACESDPSPFANRLIALSPELPGLDTTKSQKYQGCLQVIDLRGTGLSADIDSDHDGFADACDLCPYQADRPLLFPPNTTLMVCAEGCDTDRDGYGDACDPDIDGDGHLNAEDNCPTRYNPRQEDGNRNGVGDTCDVRSPG